MQNEPPVDEYALKFAEIQRRNKEYHKKSNRRTSAAWGILLVWWTVLLATHGQYTEPAFWVGVVVSSVIIGKWIVEDYKHVREYQHRINELEW